MCDETVRIDPYLLRFVPDRCVTTKMLENIDNDEALGLWPYERLVEGCNCYKQCKIHKTQMKEELLPV